MKKKALFSVLLSLIVLQFGCASLRTGEVTPYKIKRELSFERDPLSEKGKLVGRYISTSEDIGRIRVENPASKVLKTLNKKYGLKEVNTENIPEYELITADIIKSKLPELNQNFEIAQYMLRNELHNAQTDIYRSFMDIKRSKEELFQEIDLPEYVVNRSRSKNLRNNRKKHIKRVTAFVNTLKIIDTFEKEFNEYIKEVKSDVDKSKIEILKKSLSEKLSRNYFSAVLEEYLNKVMGVNPTTEPQTIINIFEETPSLALELAKFIEPWAIGQISNSFNQIENIENELKSLSMQISSFSVKYHDIRKKLSKMLGQDTNHIIEKNDYITIILKTLYVACLDTLGDAELLVTGSVKTEANAGQAVYPIFFEPDFFPGLVINNKDIILYGPRAWDGKFLNVIFNISELDEIENKSIITGFKAITQSVSALNPEFAVLSPLVNSLFSSIVNLNENDRELEISFLLPQEKMDSQTEVDFLVNETGDFIIMKRENPRRWRYPDLWGSIVSEKAKQLSHKDLRKHVYLKREDGLLYWNGYAKHIGMKSDTLFKAQTYAVLSVTTEYEYPDTLGEILRRQVAESLGEEIAKAQLPDVEQIIQMIPIYADIEKAKEIDVDDFRYFQNKLKEASDAESALIISSLRKHVDDKTRAKLGTNKNQWITAYVEGSAGNLHVVPAPIIKINIAERTRTVNLKQGTKLSKKKDGINSNIEVMGVNESKQGVLWRIRGFPFATSNLVSGDQGSTGTVTHDGYYKAPDRIVWYDKNKLVVEALSAADTVSSGYIIIELISEIEKVVVDPTSVPVKNTVNIGGKKLSKPFKAKVSRNGDEVTGEEADTIWLIKGIGYDEEKKRSGSEEVGFIYKDGSYQPPKGGDAQEIEIYSVSDIDRRVKSDLVKIFLVK